MHCSWKEVLVLCPCILHLYTYLYLQKQLFYTQLISTSFCYYLIPLYRSTSSQALCLILIHLILTPLTIIITKKNLFLFIYQFCIITMHYNIHFTLPHCLTTHMACIINPTFHRIDLFIYCVFYNEYTSYTSLTIASFIV